MSLATTDPRQAEINARWDRYHEENGKVCSICGSWKMLDSFENDKRRPDGHGPRCKWCIKQKRRVAAKYPAKNRKVILNSQGDEVVVHPTSQVVVFVKGSSKHTRRFRTFAYVRCRYIKATGALTQFWETIKFCSQPYATPEDLAQQISAESIHLALYRLGFGVENSQLDKMKLHTWDSMTTRLQEYDGLAIKQFGLRKED